MFHNLYLYYFFSLYFVIYSFVTVKLNIHGANHMYCCVLL